MQPTDKIIPVDWKYAVGAGLLSLSLFFGMKSLTNYFNKQADSHKIKWLLQKLEISNTIAQGTFITLTPDQQYTIHDENAELQIRLISHLHQKIHDPISAVGNPFMPPFEKGKLIADLSPTHRLLFNKYNILRNHVMVVPSQFQQQTQYLNQSDFNQIALVNKALQGCFFYNCGHHSGFSQKHKHIQILPEQALHFPLLTKIHQTLLHSQNITHLPFFNFVHQIKVINSNCSVQQRAVQLKKQYDRMIENIGRQIQMQYFSHNVIGSEYFLMVIARREEKYRDLVIVNSLTYLGVQPVKSAQMFIFLKEARPSAILEEVGFLRRGFKNQFLS